MIGQWTTTGLRRLRSQCFHFAAAGKLGHIGIEFFECERQLIRIEPFRPSAILRALQLPDDLPEPFDLAVAGLDPGRHVAHQTVQQRGIMRQIVEIELHVRLYTGSAVTQAFPWILRVFYPAAAGRRMRSGTRQSIPSISIDSWAELSTTLPPRSSAWGQTNPP
jgi:hypothetical protein